MLIYIAVDLYKAQSDTFVVEEFYNLRLHIRKLSWMDFHTHYILCCVYPSIWHLIYSEVKTLYTQTLSHYHHTVCE